MRKFHTLKGGEEQSYNPKLTAARVALAKTESEIEKLLDTLSGANPLLLQYANTRIEELDAERQKQLRLVADLTANSVSASQIDSIMGYLDDWESVSFDDKRKVVDILISQIDATSESVAQYELIGRKPKAAIVQKLADALDISPVSLLTPIPCTEMELMQLIFCSEEFNCIHYNTDWINESGNNQIDASKAENS